jgi:hypothetical protein
MNGSPSVAMARSIPVLVYTREARRFWRILCYCPAPRRREAAHGTILRDPESIVSVVQDTKLSALLRSQKDFKHALVACVRVPTSRAKPQPLCAQVLLYRRS